MTDNTATLDTFRQRVRQLLATAVPPDIQAARKQEGISVFLGGPGSARRHGAAHQVHPCRAVPFTDFFDQVRVPVDQLVGEANQGWHIAKGLPVIERLFVARVAECKAGLAALQSEMGHRLAGTESPGDPQHTLLRSSEEALQGIAAQIESAVASAMQDPELREKLAQAGGVPGSLAGSPFAEFVQRDIDKWKEAIDSSGVKLD